MQTKRHHIKALTMLELLIVLAASSIVFASAAKCYEVVFKQTLLIKKVVDTVEEVQQLQYLLGRDVSRAGLITAEGDRTLLMQSDSLLTSYSFGEQVILRKQAERTDTFHVPASGLQLRYVEDLPGVQLVSSIRFSGTLFEKKENFVFKKSYPVQTLLNLEPVEN